MVRTDIQPRGVKWNLGRSVYRVKSTSHEHYAMVAYLGAILLLILFGLWYSKHYIVLLLLMLVSIVVIWKIRKAPDRCSDPRCGQRLSPSENECPQCGGDISGRIKTPRDALEIEEQKFIKDFEETSKIGAEALLDLGRNYYFGYGVQPDNVRAFECHERAAQLGSVEGMLRTADQYREGDGVQADIEFAIYWYTKAMEFEKVQAPFALGEIYASGDDIEPDIKKALMYLQLASENGNKDADELIRYLSVTNFDLERESDKKL